MKTFVLINAVLEIIAGIVFLAMPSLIPGAEDSSVTGITFMRMYGAAALAVGFYAYQTLQKMDDKDWVSGFLKTFAVFHTGVATASFIGYTNGNDDALAAGVLHGVLALATLYFLFKK